MPGTLFTTFLHWSSALFWGLGINVDISLLAIGLGTLVGLAIGALYLSPVRRLRHLAGVYVIAFRNVPWLALAYGIAYAVPLEIVVRGHMIPFPDWFKVTFTLVSPTSAYVAEIFRGIVQSIPQTQWEAAASLALTRRDIFWRIVLSQCVQCMLSSWINLYAVIIMGTALASLMGMYGLLDTVQIASNTVNRTPLTVLTYFTVLALLFLYYYSISRPTRCMERAHVAA